MVSLHTLDFLNASEPSEIRWIAPANQDMHFLLSSKYPRRTSIFIPTLSGRGDVWLEVSRRATRHRVTPLVNVTVDTEALAASPWTLNVVNLSERTGAGSRSHWFAAGLRPGAAGLRAEDPLPAMATHINHGQEGVNCVQTDMTERASLRPTTAAADRAR